MVISMSGISRRDHPFSRSSKHLNPRRRLFQLALTIRLMVIGSLLPQKLEKFTSSIAKNVNGKILCSKSPKANKVHLNLILQTKYFYANNFSSEGKSHHVGLLFRLKESCNNGLRLCCFVIHNW